MRVDKIEIARRFDYHEVDEGQDEKIEYLRQRFLYAAENVVANVPSGREQSLAITALEEALMWSIAGIARPDPAF